VRRSEVEQLTSQHWFEVEETRPLNGDGEPDPGAEPVSVAVVAFGVGSLMSSQMIGYDAGVDRMCSEVFVDFKGFYEADGTTPVRNTLEARKMLYGVTAIQNAIHDEIGKIQAATARGEAAAASV
jgi:hypothetical protein